MWVEATGSVEIMNYIKNDDGNVAMMFGLLMSLMLLAIGIGVDYTNIVRMQNQLQSQVDAAVLAAATAEVKHDVDVASGENEPRGSERKSRTEAAYSVMGANGYDVEKYQPQLTLNQASVSLSAELNYTPLFGNLVGKGKMTLRAEAESGFGAIQGVDIALVIDSTRSMDFDGKMDALKEGAIKLVEAIEYSNSGSKIGLVPFARYVRLNDDVRTASWFDMPEEYDSTRTWMQATHTGGTCRMETQTRDRDGVEEEYETEVCEDQTTTYEEQSRIQESRWVGCVGTRLPPYSETDDAYSHKIPGLLDNVPASKIPNRDSDRRTWCPAEIRGLDNDYGTLKIKIKGMWTVDETYLPMGLIWGQRILSPGEPFDNSPALGETPNRQVMVLMTDGLNTTEIKLDSESQQQLRYPPYISYVDDDDVALNANAATERMCNSIKLQGIEIYTIAFQVSDQTTKTLLRDCASHPTQALTSDSNASLIQNFEKIAEALDGEIRLMR